jgi:hypothetical protein
LRGRSLCSGFNDLCRRAEFCWEVEDVADSRGAERINRLGVIANDGQPASTRLEREDDRSLGSVRVLILIDKDMVEAATDIIGKAWLTDHLSPVEQEIIVIEHILTLLGLDIGCEQLFQLGRPAGAPRERRAQHFFDREFNYVGHAAHWDRVEIDGSLAAKDCTVTYRQSGRKLAVRTIGRDCDSLAAEIELEKTIAAGI